MENSGMRNTIVAREVLADFSQKRGEISPIISPSLKIHSHKT